MGFVITWNVCFLQLVNQGTTFLNDENIFVIGSPYDLPEDKGGPVDHDACAEIARYFRREIERIIDTSDPYSTD